MEEFTENSPLLYETLNALFLFGGLIAAVLLLLYQHRNPIDRHALTKTLIGRSWSTLQVGILLAALCLLYMLASFSGLLFYEDQIPLAQLVITFLIYSILVTIITITNRKRGDRGPTDQGMGVRSIKMLLLSPLLYLAMIPIIMLASKGYHLLLEALFKSEIELQEVAQMVSGDLSWLEILYILMAIFVAPVYEELMFRGVIFPYLVKRTGLKSGILMVSLLFSLMHFHLPSFVPLVLLSAGLCLAYWRTGSLWVSIGIHTIFNAVSILALNIAG